MAGSRPDSLLPQRFSGLSSKEDSSFGDLEKITHVYYLNTKMSFKIIKTPQLHL